jgi:hypothetical protein
VSAALIESLLFAHAAPERLERVRQAAAAPGVIWEQVVSHLELHGILLLAERHLAAAGVALPAVFTERAAPLREDSRRTRFTLIRFAEQAQMRGIDVMLLKGCSLDLDVYPAPGLRTQSDIDVLVRDADLAVAIAAARAAGVAADHDQFPVWWYRLTHFHVKLRATHAFAKMMELHWRLHADALLLTDRIDLLWARAVEHRLGETRVWSLEPLDRFLHLSTHLSSHGHGVAQGSLRELLAATLAEAQPSIRLKWIVDLVAAGEILAMTSTPAALAQRAAEWSAEDDLRAVARLLRDAQPFFADVFAELERADQASGATTASPPPALRHDHGEAAATGFDFRWSALRRLPRYVWPQRSYVAKRYASAAFMPADLVRAGHAASVLARVALAGAALPVALGVRGLLAPWRRRRAKTAPPPEAVLDLVAQWRQAAKTKAPPP